jgi:N-acetylmuramoyl-L-alanine amidase
MIDVVFDIGHYPIPGDPGTYNAEFDIREHDWCYVFAHACKYVARERKLFTVKTMIRKTTIAALCDAINLLKPKLVVSFHMNGFHNVTVTGTETLYWHKSIKSKRNAGIFQKAMVGTLGLKDRGILASGLPQLGPMTKASIVMIEPGFLTNKDDLKRIHERYQLLIEAIVYGTKEVLNLG